MDLRTKLGLILLSFCLTPAALAQDTSDDEANTAQRCRLKTGQQFDREFKTLRIGEAGCCGSSVH